MKLSLVWIFFIGTLELCVGAKILFIVPMPSKSHYILGERLVDELLKKGHEVTIISAYRKSNPPRNLTEIIIPDYHQEFSKMFHSDDLKRPGGTFNMRNLNPLMFLFFGKIGDILVNGTMNQKSVLDLLNSNQKFDLVMGECFLVEGLLGGFAYRFKAPIIGLATFMPNTWANEMVGNPAPSSYIPEPILAYSDHMNFWERLVNFIYSILAQMAHHLKHIPSQDTLMHKFFGSDLGSLKDIISKTSLILVNHHFSLAFPRPYLPNMIEIGGYHLKPPKPLPKDIENFMNEAKDGVIYFSMGSNLKSAELPKEVLEKIIKIFSKLKQKVLWKFEMENLPGLPSNVKISKWLPQSDILAHPNTKLFITHGGLLSFTETVYRGVPILGVPIFGDQRLNMKIAEELEVGLSMQYEDFGEDKMYHSIMEILNNPKYAKNTKFRSQLLKDVPVPPIETAIYWIEYVIRHKGAPHLISGAQDLSWYQLYLLDVYAVLGGGVLIFFFVSYKLLGCVCRTLCGNNRKKVEASKKKN